MKIPHYAQNPLLAWREIQGEVVIISPEDSVVHELNSTASFIWKQVDSQRSAAEIAARVAEEFDVTYGAALCDTEDLLARFAEKGLLLPAAAARATGA